MCRQKTSRQGCEGRSKEDRLVGQRYHARSLKGMQPCLIRVVALDDYPVLQERPSQPCRVRRRHPKDAGASGKPLPCPQACPLPNKKALFPKKEEVKKCATALERSMGHRNAPTPPAQVVPLFPHGQWWCQTAVQQCPPVSPTCRFRCSRG